MATRLPIEAVVDEVRAALAAGNSLILEAPPGAGKSTLLPLRIRGGEWLGNQRILMLEPRRLAARAVAARMAELLGESVGQTVGYRVRFETKVGPDTQIEVVTEGVYLRMLQEHQELEGVGLVIFDEFHERSLQSDLALALTRQVQEVLRDDLRILAISATLDTAGVSRSLPQAPVIRSEGRMHPVELIWRPADSHRHIAPQMAGAIRRALHDHAEGDLLCFLPGIGDILRVERELEDLATAEVLSLHGQMPLAQQQAVLRPSTRRRVILSTAIAETSLTIEGIRVVVDSGLARVPRFDPRSGLTRLETVSVTQDAAEQRRGRAGRLGPGTCIRLWAEAAHRNLPAHRRPEIEQADLAPLALELAQWGIQDAQELAWPTPPPTGPLAQGRELLENLGALRAGKLTGLGREMAQLPAHPRLAYMFVQGQRWGVAALAAEVAALLEERDPLSDAAGADLSLRIEALQGRRSGDKRRLGQIRKVADAWKRQLRSSGKAEGSHYDIGRLVAAAYPERIAKQMGTKSRRYRLSNGRQALLNEGDPLVHEAWLAVAQMSDGGKEGRIFLAAPLHPEDLADRVETRERIEWDVESGRLLAQREELLGGHLLRSQEIAAPRGPAAEALWAEVIRTHPDLLPWTDDIRMWQARVMSLRRWNPGQDWPDVRDEALLEQIETWLVPFLPSLRKREDFAKIDLKGLLYGLLPYPLGEEVGRLAPTHIEAGTGSRIRLDYSLDGSAPVMAVRLQEMFGVHETPTVNGGKQSVLMHLLSPAMRPAQITSDLRSFWESSYHDVRKDLRGRYPKHYWPEDPWTAEPTRGVRRKKD